MQLLYNNYDKFQLQKALKEGGAKQNKNKEFQGNTVWFSSGFF